MKANQISPAMIGQVIRVETTDLTIEGQLQDLGVITETIFVGPIIRPHDTTATRAGVILNIAGHKLRLTGHETVTLAGGA